MTRCIPYAFVRITLFLMAGIVAGLTLPAVVPLVVQSIVVVTACSGYAALCILNRVKRRTIINPGFTGLMAVALVGYASVGLRNEPLHADHISQVRDSIHYYRATVVREPEVRSWGSRIVVAVQAARTTAGWQHASGQVMLRRSAHDNQTALQYGDVVVVRGQPLPVPGPANPGEFDYRNYLAHHQIVRQQTVTHSIVRKVGYAPPSAIVNIALHTRRWAEAVIRQHVPDKREQALTIALVLGVTDGLDPELLQTYAVTGTLHVLAVSGLHIGILYMVIMIVLRPLRRLPPAYSRWVTVVLAVIILWAYACITGLSPSVLRAVIMFTLLEMARLRRQPPNTYNVLAASAFLILIVDPYSLVSVGFQLSYLAVLGIVALHPGISILAEPKYWVTRKLWDMISMSLAAQLATLPLGLLYFHQFPNYFLLANLVAIPGSFLILVGGLLLLVASIIPVLASVVGTVLAWTIKSMNAAMAYLEKLPMSYTADIYITPLQAALLMGSIACGALLLYTTKTRYAAVMSVLIVVFAGVQWNHATTVANVRKLVVYNIPGQTAIDLIDRGEVYFIADSALRANPQQVAFRIAPNRIQLNATTIHEAVPFQCTLPGIAVTVWHGLSIVQITSRNAHLPRNIKADILIVSHNAVYDLAGLLKHIDAATLVLDSTNSLRYTQHTMQVASKLNRQIHAVRIAGAFEYSLQEAIRKRRV